MKTMPATSIRWLFADQLGPHFDDGAKTLIIESKSVFARRTYHRQKAHLILSALRHRALEDSGAVTLVQADTYREGLKGLDLGRVETIAATSRPARRFVDSLGVARVLPERGWFTGPEEFAAWVRSRGSKRLIMEDWYRSVRRGHGVLMDGDQPVGGRWNYDTDNRLPPPKGHTHLPVPDPWQPVEDEVDAQVRADLDRWEREGITFLGADGPRRFAVTRSEALTALEDFVGNRLTLFGPYEDAVLSDDAFMAHSLLSVPLNLGLLHPREVVGRVLDELREERASIASVEGFVRQVIGWREYVWHLYWHLGDEYEHSNALNADVIPPAWFLEARSQEIDAYCLKRSLEYVRELGYSHHIVRLMVLSNWAQQRGYSPSVVNDWFRRAFVDGYPWVMAANVIGMGLFADGGVMATKPYVSGGAYLHRMTDFCGNCRYDPKVRVGDNACPFSAGYWAFMHRHQNAFRGNHRMATALRTMEKLTDLAEVLTQEEARGLAPP